MLIIGNWKMNPQTLEEARDLYTATAENAGGQEHATIAVCPPAIFLSALSGIGVGCALGAQDVFYERDGAHTGEISAGMLQSVKAEYVILGHSERRARGETDEEVNKKARAVLSARLTPVVCVGEHERDEDGNYFAFLRDEISASLAGVPKKEAENIVIAYEPIWAVGASAERADTPEELFESIIFIRKVLSELYGETPARSVRIIYGGSVDASNAKKFLTQGGAHGLLVGRASLEAGTFGEIIRIAEDVGGRAGE